MNSIISIVICSMKRSDVLDDTVASIAGQTLVPAEIILSVPSSEDVSEATRGRTGVKVVISAQGSCVQRNRAMQEVNRASGLVCFLDDDVELDRNYLAAIANAFQDPAIALATGRIIADGCNNTPISRELAKSLLREHEGDQPLAPETVEVAGAYGCNMCVRRNLIGSAQFDERLALYGWLEDMDFSRQCSRFGKIIRVNGAALVHMGTLRGRVSGLRFGFSQIMNPLYLLKKGTLPSLYHVMTKHWAKILISNIVYSVFGDPHVDRPGRLRGNLVALRLICRGAINPEYVRELE